MVQTLRPLPLAPLRNALVSRMSQAMRGVPYRRLEDSDRVRFLRWTACFGRVSMNALCFSSLYVLP